MAHRTVAIFSDDETGPLLADAAQRVGVEPHLFFVKPPSKPLRHPWHQADPYLPPEQLGTVIQEAMGTPLGIVSCIEQLSVNLARTAEWLGIPPGPVTACEILRSKSRMKSVWETAGVRTPSSALIQRTSELQSARLDYPVIVKPTHGAASAGVRIVGNEQELVKQIRQIFRFNATTLGNEAVEQPGALIEEYIDGEEYSVDTIWYKGQPLMDGIMSKGNPQGPTFPDRLYFTDPSLDEEIEQQLLALSHAAVSAAGVYSGASHTEIRMRKQEGYVLEAALRPGAGGCFYELFERATGLPFSEAFILVSLGAHSPDDIRYLKELSSRSAKHKTRMYWYNMGYKGYGIINSIHGTEKVLSNPYVSKLAIRKNTGDYLSPESDSFAYFGWITGQLPEPDPALDYHEWLSRLETSIEIGYKTS